MIVYFALTQKTDKGIHVRFPDASAADAEGKDMSEALIRASESMGSMLVLGLKGYDYTDPSGYELIRDMAEEGEDVVPVIITEELMDRYRYKKGCQR